LIKPDEFDLYFFEQSGNPQDILQENLDLFIKSSSNAKKYLTGIRHYLEYKINESGNLEWEKENYKFAEDGSKTIEKVIVLSDSEMNDPHVIMQRMGLDPIQWEMTTCELERKAWQVTMKMAQGSDEHGNKRQDKSQTETNYAFNCKVRVKPIQDIVSGYDVAEIFEGLEPPKIEKYNLDYDSDKMLALPILDSHFGKEKLSLKEQTGVYRELVSDILAQIKSYGLVFDEIIYQIGQDHFHIDGSNKTTTSGTVVDVNDEWDNIYKVGVDNIFWTIEQFRPLTNNLYVYYVPGNHDKTLGMTAAYHFQYQYKDVPEVAVDCVNFPRKYHKFGINLIGMSHGRDEKRRIKDLMQTDVPEMWGQSKVREWHLGDEHHEEAEEDGGVIIRRISSFTQDDSWHTDKGYTGAVKKMQAFVYDRKLGKRLTIDSSVSYEVDQ